MVDIYEQFGGHPVGTLALCTMGASLQCASLLAFSTYTGRRLCPKGPLPEPIFSSVQRANFVSPVAVPISAGPRRFHLPGLDRTRSSLLHLRALG